MKIRKDRRRGAYTYCALICSDPSIQPFLPHFLISSQTWLPSSLLRAYNALPRTQLQIIRGKSSWVTADCMLVILQAVKKALMPFLAGISPVIMWDCACPHLPKTILVAAKRHGFQLLYIPASTTSLLQPLDVFAFWRFKSYLRQKYREQRQTAAEGQPEPLA